ncbi:hypothetical protein LV716_17740 [Flagellimonas sp. HMM57]|uniref:hypothetical protein n=1 Tax=unclassified Flagellimonas TaxID=2644544 RepID=UPI0013D157A2|nr:MULTISPECIES: hypothetical protein [unclassified Flagellimonas]UII76085.1 hypothetical protein LV716_17740 [Flagellimonas sp. HMM57]
MRILVSLFCLIFCLQIHSQEILKKRYRVRPKLSLKTKKYDLAFQPRTIAQFAFEGLPKLVSFERPILTSSIGEGYLVKDSYVKYKSLASNDSRREKVDKQIALVANSIVNSTELFDLNGKKITITEKEAKNPDLLEHIAVKTTSQPDFYSTGQNYKYKANVLFEKDKLFVNIWNFTDSPFKDDKETLYYQLSDGQTARLNFQEITISTLVLPLKYRFKDDPILFEEINDMMETTIIEKSVPETFTSGINVSIFGGYTWGTTRFHYRKKVGNRTIVNKHTIGGLLGTGTETLSANNTDGTSEAPKGSDEFSIGLLSTGFGYVYSRNKFAIGAFFGFDFGVGSVSNTWNYDNRPWIGIGLGYDIFKL